jgi:hypothetical protein
MIRELDRVVLSKPLPELDLVAGDVGIVVLVHENERGYEVEFLTLEGETYALATVARCDVRPIRSDEIASARKLRD